MNTKMFNSWPADNKAWKKVEKRAKKQRNRVRKAMMAGNRKKAYKLADQLCDSHLERLLAVRRVTQENRGSQTAGADGLIYRTAAEKVQLVHRLRTEFDAQPDPLLAVTKTKDDGTERKMFIPTLFDRARQTVLANVIRTLNDFQLSPGTFGTDRSRDIPNAYAAIVEYLGGEHMCALRTDITHCYDKISRAHILAAFEGPRKLRNRVAALLDAEIGIADSGMYPGQGAPQGMPLSPVLVTIALDYLEPAMLNEMLDRPERAPLFVRYVDDILILHPDEKVIDDCYQSLNNVLDDFGHNLMLNDKKTVINTTEVPFGDTQSIFGPTGFTFLGWQLVQYPSPPEIGGEDDIYLTLKPKKDCYKGWARRAGQKMAKAVKGRALVVDNFDYPGWDTRQLALEHQQAVLDRQQALREGPGNDWDEGVIAM